jgi:hypothetical protein
MKNNTVKSFVAISLIASVYSCSNQTNQDSAEPAEALKSVQVGDSIQEPQTDTLPAFLNPIGPFLLGDGSDPSHYNITVHVVGGVASLSVIKGTAGTVIGAPINLRTNMAKVSVAGGQLTVSSAPLGKPYSKTEKIVSASSDDFDMKIAAEGQLHGLNSVELIGGEDPRAGVVQRKGDVHSFSMITSFNVPVNVLIYQSATSRSLFVSTSYSYCHVKKVDHLYCSTGVTRWGRDFSYSCY